MDLEDWGWDESWKSVVPPGVGGAPARVVEIHGESVWIQGGGGVRTARRKGSRRSGVALTVGDWVLEENGIVLDLLPRRTWVKRVQGRQEQFLAANLDVLFVVSGLGEDFNPRRLERYLVLALEGQVLPVFVLNKCDLRPPEQPLETLRRIAPGREVLVTSGTQGTGVGELQARLGRGRTGAFVGSSGVGKSTLLNALLGVSIQEVAPVGERERGTHTTTARSLLHLPGGGLVIDTPGLREVGVSASGVAVAEAFEDLVVLADGCRFRNCRHETEPGCSLIGAVAEGALDPERLSSFLKLRREAERAGEDHLARSRRVAGYKAIERSLRKLKDPD